MGEVKIRIPLVFANQCGAGAFDDRLLGQCLLVGGDLVDLHDGVVLVVEVEQVRCDSHAHGVPFATIAVNFNPHDTLLATRGFLDFRRSGPV
jgi:hypothetical protein